MYRWLVGNLCLWTLFRACNARLKNISAGIFKNMDLFDIFEQQKVNNEI
jgi:hypothetical protein